MKRTPLIRKTPLQARRGFAATAVIREAKKRLTAAFDESGKALTAYPRKTLTAKPKPKPTKAERERWAAARVRGCVACYLNETERFCCRASYGQSLEIHHLLSGGRRRGHRFTVCLCEHHHQAARLIFADLGYQDHAVMYGPSFGREPRRFREVYRDDDALLALQDWMIENLPARFPEAA
ncbi:Ref family recombination enhancement nuclease [Luteibacter yeojuensis]|uniref:Uncharacterized protein n=1 Tax=Luteibacter yeojuensis TaxID=345309 RepID=A0A7X5QU54_9GAMM|nr:Ref family recombination enhancement nuclease [Luteibacter yeojuensis]NID15404.1 hypothetical protein [Luteibacter yeojuensis]